MHVCMCVCVYVRVRACAYLPEALGDVVVHDARGDWLVGAVGHLVSVYMYMYLYMYMYMHMYMYMYMYMGHLVSDSVSEWCE